MNILILRVSAIGDVIHTLPSIFLIKQCIPDAKIHWIVQEKAASIIKDQPFLEHVWTLPNKFFSPQNIRSTYTTIKKLKTIHWDAIIDFQGLLKTSLLLMPLKGPKFGFVGSHARWKQSAWFTDHHTTPNYTNIIQKNLALAGDVIASLTQAKNLPTVQSLASSLKLSFSDLIQKNIRGWLATISMQPIIALAPNTTWPSKHWPTEQWLELCKLIHQTYPTYAIVLLGTHHGQAAANLKLWADKNKIQLSIAPSWNLLEIAYFLQHVAIMIAPDTGLLHLADFLGVQSVGIFGPTSKEKHGPWLRTYNQKNAIQVPCPHTYQKTHGQNVNCMNKLMASTVMHHIEIILTKG